nr:MAG TPA: hypothetical protein [Inoviridae sp.]
MKFFNVAKKYGNKVIVATTLTTISALAAAEGVDLSGIGTTAAAEIAKFAVMVSAIGAAVLSVIVLMQGFRMAFSMVKTAK